MPCEFSKKLNQNKKLTCWSTNKFTVGSLSAWLSTIQNNQNNDN